MNPRDAREFRSIVAAASLKHFAGFRQMAERAEFRSIVAAASLKPRRAAGVRVRDRREFRSIVAAASLKHRIAGVSRAYQLEFRSIVAAASLKRVKNCPKAVSLAEFRSIVAAASLKRQCGALKATRRIRIERELWRVRARKIASEIAELAVDRPGELN